MENDFKEKLNGFIYNSALSKDDKLLWQLFLKISQPEEDEAVYQAAKEDVDNLEILTKHLADKIFDMGKDNKRVWEMLTKDEKKFAEFMSKLC